MICEKCWADAGMRVYGGDGDRYAAYLRLLEERKGNPCTPEQQRGERVERGEDDATTPNAKERT